jgi:hypothetical protein
MKHLLSILLGFSFMAQAQNCSQNLEEAQIAFFNGRFQSCIELLKPCVETYAIKEDRIMALEILAKSQLMLGQKTEAEASMYRILSTDPFYQVRPDLSVSLEELYHQFRLVRQWQLGFNLSYLAAKYSLLKTWSFSGVVEESTAYEARPSMQFETWGSYTLYRGLQVEAGLAFQAMSFYRAELQQNYLLQSSLEDYQFISPRLGLQYEYAGRSFSGFVNFGGSMQILQSARADMALNPQIGEIPAAFGGYPESQENLDLSFQRKSLLNNLYAGIGLRYGRGHHRFELSYRFQHAWTNLVIDDQRFSDANLLNNLAYVPDDFSFNYGLWQVGYLYTFLKPQKK